MPWDARNARTFSVPEIVRFSVGMLTTAMIDLLFSSHRLEQELEDLDVTFRLAHVPAPGIEAVTLEQERVRLWMAPQHRPDFLREPRHVLIVGDNRNPLAVLVRLHAVEAFQHLVAGD